MRVHEPGECFDSLYGAECNGIASYVVDPYVQEIYGEIVYEWICDGVYEGKCMDI